MRKLRSRLSLFAGGKWQASAPCGLGPADAEAQRKLSSWGPKVELAEKFEKETALSKNSAASSSALQDPDTLSLESSDTALKMKRLMWLVTMMRV